MARQYKRFYELTIIPPGGEARVITGLRLVFTVTKSVLGYPNLARLQLYNPNPTTLAALQSKFTKVQLVVGYEGSSGLVFVGDVRNVLQSKQGVDRIATVYAGDGQRAWQNASINKTYAEGVTIQSIVSDIASTFEGIAVGVLGELRGSSTKPLGQTFSGSSKDVLDELSREYGFNWSIQNEEIKIVPTETPLLPDEAVLVTSRTGMIGSPTVTEIGADVTTLLNVNLQPEAAFVIESVGADFELGNLFFRNVKRTDAAGLYKVQQVDFTGDFRDGDWTSTVKGRRVV